MVASTGEAGNSFPSASRYFSRHGMQKMKTALPSPTRTVLGLQGLRIDETWWQAMAKRETHFFGQRYFCSCCGTQKKQFQQKSGLPANFPRASILGYASDARGEIRLGYASSKFLAQNFRKSTFLLYNLTAFFLFLSIV